MIRTLLVCFFIFCVSEKVFSQEQLRENDSDTSRVMVSTGTADVGITQDTAISRHAEVAQLDIGQNRGLFILSSDKRLMMRILGSVRFLFNSDNRPLASNVSFNPYEIPTGEENFRTPNLYAGLTTTRLGFEVTRRTEKLGDIFIRIESDFNGANGAFRIRHAYGQTKYFLVGQTWSLFSNVNYVPATVSSDGPVGSIYTRTPQLRYFRTINSAISWYAGLEFSNAELFSPDTVDIELLQVIPDLTLKADIKKEHFGMQASLLVTTIATRTDSTDQDRRVSYSFGIGASISGKYSITDLDHLFFSATLGQAIQHYISMYSGKNADAIFDTVNQELVGLFTFAGFLTYQRNWPKNLSSSASFGISPIKNEDFQSEFEYSYGYNLLVNAFWTPAAFGARVGIEYAYGKRFNIGPTQGYASRIGILMYYDF